MNVLGLDTSTARLALAIVNEQGLVAELHTTEAGRHSARLAPMIQALLKMARLELGQVDGFAVGIGPGSFTGLRVGVTTMKALALSTGHPIVGVPTLDALAHQVSYWTGLVCPILDAKRGLVYAAIYQTKAGKVKRASRYRVIAVPELVKACRGSTLFVGDGIPLYQSVIRKMLNSCAQFADPALWCPQGSVIARLGREALVRGERDAVDDLVPLYIYPKDVQVRK